MQQRLGEPKDKWLRRFKFEIQKKEVSVEQDELSRLIIDEKNVAIDSEAMDGKMKVVEKQGVCETNK